MPVDSNPLRSHAASAVLLLVACTLAAASNGCATTEIPMTQLQVRQMQTREYDIRDSDRAVKAILDVLQDEGFIPREVNARVGYIYAVKEVDIEDPSEKFWANFWHNRRDAQWRKDSVIECAANVTQRTPGIRVRLTFQVKIMDNHGQVQSVETIHEPGVYQDFFSRVDKGIFLEKSGV